MRDIPPTVSVVVPLYNTERYICEALNSVLAQTYTDWEVIVVDDGSDDQGPEIAKRYAAQDPRIRLVQQKNRGLAGARNTGIRHAKGRYIALLDADDAWQPIKLERHVAHLDEEPLVGVSYSGSRFIDEDSIWLNARQRPQLEAVGAPLVLCRNPVGNGSRPCENDFGPPKSPSGSRRIAEERRTEQYFPTAPGGVCRSDDLTGQPHGTWMVPMRAFGRITPTP